MRIFIDTEFTDFRFANLISIGLVDENDRTFYAEFTDYNKNLCSDFVNETVIPLLGKTPNTIVGNKDEIASELISWLSEYNNPVVCADFSGDIILLFELLDNSINFEFQHIIPNQEMMEEFTLKNGYPLHHALYDAMRNKYGFIAG